MADFVTYAGDPVWEAIRFFKPEEFVCRHCGELKISIELLTRLDRLRDACGIPLVITSGYRCPEWNSKVSKVEKSAHTRGYAVDIKAVNSRTRLLIVRNAIALGFRRIGIADSFVHLDVDPDKPQDVMWVY